MGNIGSIEKVMVFGILVIIVTILGIAFYSATKMDNDLTANQMDASGQDPVVLLDDPGSKSPAGLPTGRSSKPVAKDVRPDSTGVGALDNTFKSLKSNVQQNDQPVGKRSAAGDRSGIRIQQTPDSQNHQGTSTYQETTHQAQKNMKAEPEYYKVQKGDSFMSIARVVFGDERKFKLLMQANPHIDPMSLQIGQKLIIPDQLGSKKNSSRVTPTGSKKESTSKPSVVGGGQVGRESLVGAEYVVKSGDTLASISMSIYGTSKKWKKIYEANRAVISNPDVLSVGDVLTLPQNP